MTQKQEQQLLEYMTFKETIIHSPDLLENYPATKPHFEIFCQQLQLIIKFKNMLIESENITDHYSRLRDELARNIITFSRKITAFALLEELTELQGMFCYSYEELFVANDERILEISHHILKKSTEYLTGIAEYGLTDQIISKFEETIEKFSIIKNDKLSADFVAEDAGKNIVSLLASSDLMFQSKLVPLVNASVNNSF